MTRAECLAKLALYQAAMNDIRDECAVALSVKVSAHHSAEQVWQIMCETLRKIEEISL